MVKIFRYLSPSLLIWQKYFHERRRQLEIGGGEMACQSEYRHVIVYPEIVRQCCLSSATTCRVHRKVSFEMCRSLFCNGRLSLQGPRPP
ncbi:hypothetical protein CEXT_14261 [Caerostris extrusa]|uniref:Uncharacterized protein n=1 Tax=Caerostris extrusa TaxID=172846 RepID=A0AAV4X552_CAEEX|nr:hypothetical protein CEXT_14261 [Caerostris extrusa]